MLLEYEVQQSATQLLVLLLTMDLLRSVLIPAHILRATPLAFC